MIASRDYIKKGIEGPLGHGVDRMPPKGSKTGFFVQPDGVLTTSRETW